MLAHIWSGALPSRLQSHPAKHGPAFAVLVPVSGFKRGQNTFLYKRSQCFGDVTSDGCLPLFLNERVCQDWKSPRKYSKALKGSETRFALLIFII